LEVKSSRVVKRREAGAATPFPSGDPKGGINLAQRRTKLTCSA